VDAHVHEVQVAVDQPRFDILYESASEIPEDKRRAQVFASWGVYLLVGYEQASLPGDPGALEWIAHQWLGSLDSGVYTSVSGDD
jgi:hypothetical protein